MGKIRRKQLEAVYETTIRVLIVIAICWVISMLTSCKSVETVRVPEVHIDTLIQTKWRTDSVVMRDSVVITETAEGRTKFVVRWRDRVRILADTTYICLTDSVPVPYPVEKKLTKSCCIVSFNTVSNESDNSSTNSISVTPVASSMP